jgi:K+-sensing histidine kinase KdpD
VPPPDGGAPPRGADDRGVPSEAVLLWTHDVRSPLAALVANLHHVREVIPAGDADGAEVVGECLALCGVLERYVTNLEVVHRGRVGRGPTRVRLRDVAADVVRRLSPHAVMTEHQLALDAPGGAEPIVTADATLLRVALEDLVSSAMEQAPPGVISLEVTTAGGEGLVTIVDGGPPWPVGGGGAFELSASGPRGRLAGDRDGRGLGLPAAAAAAAAAGARLFVAQDAAGGPRVGLGAPLTGAQTTVGAEAP